MVFAVKMWVEGGWVPDGRVVEQEVEASGPDNAIALAVRNEMCRCQGSWLEFDVLDVTRVEGKLNG